MTRTIKFERQYPERKEERKKERKKERTFIFEVIYLNIRKKYITLIP
jgi:hypothetical protein